MDTTNSIDIPIEIVKNFVQKFIRNENIFLSISTASSNMEQKLVQNEIVTNLLEKSEIKYFTYAVLKNIIYQFRRKLWDAFNILIVDNSESLS